MNKNEIALYESSDGVIKLEVEIDGETVWLNKNQIAALFDRDVKTIGKHINNALREELTNDSSTVAFFATVQMEGEREVERDIEHYILDVIISVGYRVKSKRGVEFRRWANKVLKDYIINGVMQWIILMFGMKRGLLRLKSQIFCRGAIYHVNTGL